MGFRIWFQGESGAFQGFKRRSEEFGAVFSDSREIQERFKEWSGCFKSDLMDFMVSMGFKSFQ